MADPIKDPLRKVEQAKALLADIDKDVAALVDTRIAGALIDMGDAPSDLADMLQRLGKLEDKLWELDASAD